MSLRIGTAGWSIPRAAAEAFVPADSGLARYATRLNAVEINSSFYRSHRPQTYARWAASTPDDFRFSIKMPRAITHAARLVGAEAGVEAFIAEASHLGGKAGPLLIQLPPSLACAWATQEAFFAMVRALWSGAVCLEPRHASWFDPAIDALLSMHRISRVAADPARHPGAGQPGGWLGFAYWRLHGSPRIYSTAYGPERLAALADQLSRSGAAGRWCIFDNTASGAATTDALQLGDTLASPPHGRPAR
jgi:uncharacterized protein YecE (DUF72 family)